MSSLRTPLVASLLVALVGARDVPANVRDFYDSVVGQGECSNVLADGFYSTDNDGGS